MFQPAYESSNVPPVPSLPTHNHLPLKNVDYTVATPTAAPTPTSHSLNTVSEAKEEDSSKDDGGSSVRLLFCESRLTDMFDSVDVVSADWQGSSKGQIQWRNQHSCFEHVVFGEIQLFGWTE